ncbi:MAG: hypothetical protein COA67_09220 [Lutibacter sp.]|nr:MAG: hypothetical protein COA67_09220 [Lutibacter sp.]
MISTKKLHIVSFDVPFPANYGGVIDVFYKLIELHKIGVEIHFHTFEYGRGKQKELEKYCKKVYYYHRNSFIKSFFSKDPFIVKSRENRHLISNLTADNSPILFEGLHTTSPIFLKAIKNQKTFVRAHNIEHLFYKGLSESESSVFKKTFFKQESKKLIKYESILKKVDGIFTISPFEHAYFLEKYGEKATYIPAFHEVTKNFIHTDNSKKTVLFHGNILVPENIRAILFLISIYKNSIYNLVIASSHQNKNINTEIDKHKNIQFVNLKSQDDLKQLFRTAHINVLPTFQKTGIKLKLLNALYQGKFIIANNNMVEDTGLEELTEIANSKEEFLQKTAILFDKKFNQEIVNKRLEKLKSFDPQKSAQKIVDIIFN